MPAAEGEVRHCRQSPFTLWKLIVELTTVEFFLMLRFSSVNSRGKCRPTLSKNAKFSARCRSEPKKQTLEIEIVVFL
jgi:hypothetical protein